MELILHGDEPRLLQQILTQHLGDLKMEIGKTENFNWRQEQKHDEAMLKAMIARLAQAIDDDESPEPAERIAEPADA